MDYGLNYLRPLYVHNRKTPGYIVLLIRYLRTQEGRS